jgi:glycerol-3-phosphate acyltransferase PlsY
VTGAEALGLALAYLIGAVPVGLLSGLAAGVDVRRVGSGNIGATNVMRAIGPLAGLAVFVADVLKGAGAVALCRALGVEGWLLGMAALFAVMGHCFSPYLAFKGGKGVATTLGAFLALHPLPALVCLGVWILAVAVTRYVSLGSMVAVGIAPIVFYMAAPSEGADIIVILAALALLVIGRHNDNLERLLRGTENRIGRKRGTAEPSTEAESDE